MFKAADKRPVCFQRNGWQNLPTYNSTGCFVVVGLLVQLAGTVDHGIKPQCQQELLPLAGTPQPIPIQLQFTALIGRPVFTIHVKIGGVYAGAAAQRIWLANKAIRITRQRPRQIGVVNDTFVQALIVLPINARVRTCAKAFNIGVGVQGIRPITLHTVIAHIVSRGGQIDVGASTPVLVYGELATRKQIALYTMVAATAHIITKAVGVAVTAVRIVSQTTLNVDFAEVKEVAILRADLRPCFGGEQALHGQVRLIINHPVIRDGEIRAQVTVMRRNAGHKEPAVPLG